MKWSIASRTTFPVDYRSEINIIDFGDQRHCYCISTICKLVIKNAYGDVETEVKLERDLFLALFNYKDKLIGPLGYIFSIERNCENFGNQRVFKITKNIIYNDSNLLNTSASLLIRAFYMEKEGYSPEAKILYEESISKAKSDQIKIYKDLYRLFKARWNIE